MWNILGVNVEAWDQRRAIDVLDTAIAAGIPTCVAFANSNLINLAARNSVLRGTLAGFTVLNDGLGMDIAARILHGKSFPSNLNGTDFVPAYLENTVHAHRIFIVGARPEVAKRAARALQQRFGGKHEVVGFTDGYSGVGHTGQVLAAITGARATLLLVGMGNPRQEIWLGENMVRSGSNLGFGVGALLDFAAGEVRRAPRLIRSLRLEWAYRLTQEPRRLFRRYMLEAPVFVCRLVSQRLRTTTYLRRHQWSAPGRSGMAAVARATGTAVTLDVQSIHR